MEITLADQYYLKASVDYPWRIETALENLNYALSYEEEHAQAWCLQGEIHMYSLKNYKKAEISFNNALRSDLNYVDSYKHLILLKIWMGQHAKAFELIDYASNIEVMNQATMLGLKAMIFEVQGRFKAAQKILIKARLLSLDYDTIDWLKNISKRIKDKQKMHKKAIK